MRSLSTIIVSLTRKLMCWSTSTRMRMFAIVLCVIVSALIIQPDVAFAQSSDKLTETLNEINISINIILGALSSVFWPILLMIGSLLDNTLIFGGSMEERLLSGWVEIRNLVNIVFVLILLAIAVYNVLGLGQDGGPLPLAYKTVMPKFLLALIAVNFSFLAVKVVVDFSNVITGAVFALPTKTIETEGTLATVMSKAICAKRSKDIPVYDLWCTTEKQFNDKAKEYFNRLDRSNIAVVYAIRYGRAHELKFIRDGIKDLGQLGFNIIFNTILFAVYTASFLALFLVLLTRLVVIWLALVMSPVVALTIVLPNLSSLGGDLSSVSQKLIKSITAPITIGLAMSVGYIMLDALAADVTVDPLLASSSLTSIDANALPTGITSLQQLLIAMGSVVVVFTGVFGAASDTFAGSITNAIKERMVGWGKFLRDLPLYMQFIPIKAKDGTEKDYSIKDVLYTMQRKQDNYQRVNDFTEAALAPEELTKLKGYLKSDTRGLAEALKNMPQVFTKTEGWRELIDYLKTNHRALGIKEEDVEKELGEVPDAAKLAKFINDRQTTASQQFKDIMQAPDIRGDMNKLVAKITQQAAKEIDANEKSILEAARGGVTDVGSVSWKPNGVEGAAWQTQWENFQKFIAKVPSEIEDIFVDVKNKKLDFTEGVTHSSQIGGQVKAFYDALAKAREASDQGAFTAALKIAKDNMNGIPPTIRTQIVDRIQFPGDESDPLKKKQALATELSLEGR